MSVTVFGIIWLSLMIYAFFRLKIKHFIFLTLFSMLFQCNNIFIIGTQGVGPQLVTSFCFIIKSYLVKYKHIQIRLTKHILRACCVFLLYIVINSLKNHVFNIRVLDIFQLLIYYCCAVRMYRCKLSLREEDLKKYIIIIISFIAVFSPIQLLATYGFIPRGILTPFFFNDLGDFVYFHRPEIYKRLLGTFMEPSYCSSFIVGAILYVLHLRRTISHSYILLIILTLELILTKSSTGYGTLAIMLIIYFLSFRNKNALKIAVPICLIAAVVFLVAKDTLLNEVIFNKMSSESGVHRSSINARAIETFLEEPIWGIGWKESRASSYLLCLLAELGLIGCVLYLFVFALSYSPIIFNKKKHYNENIQAIHLFFISVCVAQIIAIPDIQFTVFWLGIYLISLSYSNITKSRACNRYKIRDNIQIV